jgi:release factor glutamine methyltransferase
MMTRDHAYRMLAWRLKEAGLDSPELDARLLTRAACGCSEIEMIREPGTRLSDEEVVRLAGFEARRLAREPVSRILGTREFWGLSFFVTPAVLDPRADSETLVETALELLAEIEAPRVLDLGTGSGCLLIALLHERNEATGVGLDISQAALEVARRNAQALGVGDRASFRHGDWAQVFDERFDLVIANPPYIPAADIAGLETEVRDHDPRLALDGGADGLDAYRAIAPLLLRLLTARGHGVIELGQGQAGQVTEIFRAADLDVRRVVSDLAGVPRALVAGLRGE